MTYDLIFRNNTSEKFTKIKDIDINEVIENIKIEIDKVDKLNIKIFKNG